jgi:NAD(P)-dependent dehydrogenase (short-subunit alcohol dehydrogenase family)
VVEDIVRGGGEAIAGPADVTEVDQMTALVERAERALGPIDVLINNAGGSLPGAKWSMLHEADIDDIKGFLWLNLGSMFVCSRAVLPGMVARRYGKIVCVSSISAALGQMGGTGYAAAKAGVAGLVRSLAKEVGAYGINVNAVMYGNAPHHTRTEERQRDLDSWSHLHRVGRPDEFAKATIFLASDDASYITGEVLRADGGLTRFALL